MASGSVGQGLPQSASEITRTTVASVESGPAFYGRTLRPDIREAVEQKVFAGYKRATSEERLYEFNEAAHELSTRVVDGLTADLLLEPPDPLPGGGRTAANLRWSVVGEPSGGRRWATARHAPLG